MRRKITAGLMGLVLLLPNYLEAGEKPDSENEKPAVEIRQVEKKPIDIRQDVIKKEIKDFTSEYLNEGEKTQKSLRDAIKNNSLEKVVDTFGLVGFDYLALAREKVDSPEKYNEKQLEEKYQEISKNYMIRLGEVMKHTPLDYSAEEVRKCWALWIKLKTEFSEKLLTSDINPENYSELVKKTFSVEEYRDFLEREIEIIRGIYAAFYNAKTGIVGLFAEKDLNSDRDFQIRFSERRSYETYPEAKPEEEKKAAEEKIDK